MLLLSSLNAHAKTYVLALEISPPFSFEDDTGEMRGLAVDMVGKLASELDAELNIIVCPWARCMKLVEDGEADFIFGVQKNAEREKSLFFIEPAFIQLTSDFAFYRHKTEEFDVKSYAELKDFRIGVQRGAKYFLPFDQDESLTKIEVVDINTTINLLLKDRIDLFVMPKVSAQQYISSKSLENQIDTVSYSYQTSEGGYIALSKKSTHFPDSKRLSEAFAKLKAQGTVGAILSDYNLQ